MHTHSSPSPTPRTNRPPSAFTLIELLVVISIIAILASLAIPAVQGALGSAKKAQARNDVHQIAQAFKSYQLEYGRLPGNKTTDGSAPENWVTILTSKDDTDNPRGIVFFEPKAAKGGKGGLKDGKYYDPWGIEYKVTLDYNYDNKIQSVEGIENPSRDPFFTTVVVVSQGGTNVNVKNTISNVK